jgi:hypothetical protein
MRLHELARVLDLEQLTSTTPGPTPGDDATGSGVAATDPDLTQGYASDLLSDVLANAPSGGVLITLQVHLNVIAVAGHAGLAAVIFSSGRRPDDEVIDRSAQEGIALFSSAEDTFDLVGRLYSLGIRGASA